MTTFLWIIATAFTFAVGANAVSMLCMVMATGVMALEEPEGKK